jgi:prepilin-type N-terminal cleavage/methylation domain-containing protein
MNTHSGFSLLEVLIATAIMLFGVAGYVQLQSHYIKLDHTLNLRQQAVFLANEKLQDLRRFSVLHASAGQISYQNIHTDTGGQIGSGAIAKSLWQSQAQTIPFELHWQVTNMYFVDTDHDALADTWKPEGDANLPQTLPVIAPKKRVQISVAWQDQFGETLSIAMNSEITPIPFARSLHVSNTNIGESKALEVLYEPADNNIDFLHRLTPNLAVQSTAPTIDVVNNEIVVEIEQNRVELLLPEYEKTQVENQLIIGCECRLGTTGFGKTPAMSVLQGNKFVTQQGSEVVKSRGEALPAQHAKCEQCCNDHHDTMATVDTQNYYRLEAGGIHHHYDRIDQNTFIKAINEGDKYQEVCRFKQIDGFYHLAPDLELLSLTEFNVGHLELLSNRNAYTDYIKQLLAAYIRNTASPVPLSGRNIQLPIGQFQLMAFGVYMERLYSNDKAYLNSLIEDGDDTWFSLVPFYDVNMTLLANWYSSDTQRVNILQQAIQTVENVGQDYYASYQRGVIETLASGSSRINVQVSGSNSGLIGHPPLSPYEVLNEHEGSGVEIIIQP